MMLRQEAIEALAKARNGALSVAIMQSCAPWHDAGQADDYHLDAQGCMGSAASIGLGLALACPDRKVMVLDGDGSLLMQLGSLVTVADTSPPNFYHFVFGNGLHQSTGNQPLPAVERCDLCQIAKGAGYRDAVTFEEKDALERALPGILSSPGPILVRLGIAREDDVVRWPRGEHMHDMVRRVRAALA